MKPNLTATLLGDVLPSLREAPLDSHHQQPWQLAASRPSNKAPGVGIAGDPFVIPDGMFDNISNVLSWDATVTRMCDSLKISGEYPNLHEHLTTRHGSKKVHTRFNEMYRRLDAAYVSAKRGGNEKAMGGVVAIMTKMGADAILKDKLFEKGLLKKVEIARQSSTLVKLMQDFPLDPKIVELVVTTVARATEAAVACEAAPAPRLVQDASIRAVLEGTVAVFRRFVSSYVMFTHAISLFVAPYATLREGVQGCFPHRSRFLTALTRSRVIEIRATGFTGLLRLPISECEFEQIKFVPQRVCGRYQRGAPQHLSAILVEYGPEKAETALTVNCTIEYQKAIFQAMIDRDLYALGKKLANIIQRTELVIGEGSLQMEGPTTSSAWELEPARRKMNTAMEFMDHTGYPIARTQLNLARELLLRLYIDAAREWGPLVKRFDELQLRAVEAHNCTSSNSEPDDGLADWLEKLDMDDPDDEHGIYMRAHAHDHPQPHNAPKAKNERASHELYRCSWCGNPSAAGAGATKYCDVGCQTSHWAEHNVE
ncbi:hypothetical protein BC628DRAFT_1420841 [Trametes gibbosa]|nr:hypothetical protein BC628DRAFT_1420841 [Trametes gibbosa]